MKKTIITSLRTLGIMVLILGIAYPLVVTGITQLCFPSKAHGSLIEADGIVKGSELIGQRNDSSAYFQPRPSATDYNTLPSGASNLALTNKKLHELMLLREKEIREKYQLSEDTHIPSEMLFASASGLDPHISPEAAKIQVNRIAETRSLSDEQKQQVNLLVDKLTETPQFGIFGCERVNVFMLNLELDRLK